LLGLTFVVLLAALGLAARPAAIALEGRVSILAELPAWTPIAAGAVGLVALWPVMMIAPPRGREPIGPVWRDIWQLSIGVAAWSLLIIASGVGEIRGWSERTQELLAFLRCAPAVIGLIGLNGILKVIGLRSREYRTSRGGRQSTQAMIAAVIFAAVGHALILFRWRSFGPAAADITDTAHLLVFMAKVMLLIGLAYLVINAWWIRRALRHPPPTLADLLGESARLAPR
jgi:hypothetical protein